MNNKGFMMAELVVVSSIIVLTLTGLYISYNKIITSYRQIINYYDIGFYYKLGYYNMALYKNKKLDEALSDVDTKDYVELSNSMGISVDATDIVYIIKDKDVLSTLKTKVTHQTYKDYIDYLIDSKDLGNNYIIIGEQCLSDENNCKYAYAEVANEEIK